MIGKMMDLRWAIYIALLCSTIVQGNVEIEPKEPVAIRLGEKLDILCKMSTPLKFCRFEIPGVDGGVYVLSKDDKKNDDIEYYGRGLEHGECGVRVARIKDSHNGYFKCELTPKESRKADSSSVRVIVARPPNKPHLQTSFGVYAKGTFRKGQKLEISCSASSGRPAANLSLYLDDEPLNNEDSLMAEKTRFNDETIAYYNTSRLLDSQDNGRMLRCVANHIALDSPKETSILLQVQYPPEGKGPFEHFGYVIGRQGVVNVTILANPRPRFVWRINNDEIHEGSTDGSRRIEALQAKDLGKGAWSVILKIDSIQKSDTEKEYVLKAHNDEGSAEYRITLSTSAEPAGFELDAGSIVGIIVGILVLLLIVCIVIFARATGRWCFAGGSATRNLGESSDTESAGRYSRSEVDGNAEKTAKPRISLSKIFKRNKDKVSGADTDTIRTVVTVDDDKIQSMESVDTERPGEGGIVYAELDLTQQQQGISPRSLNEDKTEYAEILYTKPEDKDEEKPSK